MVNRYRGTCPCGEEVAPGMGTTYKNGRRWVVVCAECEPREHVTGPRSPRTITTRFSSGAVVYRNAKGRCEDAPCCGCCS